MSPVSCHLQCGITLYSKCKKRSTNSELGQWTRDRCCFIIIYIIDLNCLSQFFFAIFTFGLCHYRGCAFSMDARIAPKEVVHFLPSNTAGCQFPKRKSPQTFALCSFLSYSDKVTLNIIFLGFIKKQREYAVTSYSYYYRHNYILCVGWT